MYGDRNQLGCSAQEPFGPRLTDHRVRLRQGLDTAIEAARFYYGVRAASAGQAAGRHVLIGAPIRVRAGGLPKIGSQVWSGSGVSSGKRGTA